MEIIATFMVAGANMAEEQRQREEQARREKEVGQRGKQDWNRWRRFSEIANAWDEVGTARRFLRTLRKHDLPEDELVEGRTLTEWLDWAERKLIDADPLERGLAAILGDVANIRSWTYHK